MATKLEIDQLCKNIGLEPSLTSFDNRLRIQKACYIMQNIFNVDLGFNYTWYIHGPYCSDLTKVMFGDEKGTPLTDETTNNLGGKIEKLKQFVKSENLTRHYLEILASLHYIMNIEKKSDKSEIIKTFSELKPQFHKDEIESAYDKLFSVKV